MRNQSQVQYELEGGGGKRFVYKCDNGTQNTNILNGDAAWWLLLFFLHVYMDDSIV